MSGHPTEALRRSSDGKTIFKSPFCGTSKVLNFHFLNMRIKIDVIDEL